MSDEQDSGPVEVELSNGMVILPGRLAERVEQLWPVLDALNADGGNTGGRS